MILTSRQWLIIGVVIVVLLVGGVAVYFWGTRNVIRAELTFWGLDHSSVWSDIIRKYESENPGIKIKYEQINPEVYESNLINALAAGRGPDILMLENAWLPKHGDKLAPAPPELISAGKAQALFPTIVEQDFTASDQVFALPLFIDTLALFYNPDIFDEKRIALTPQNWIEFEKVAERLGFGGTAFGGSNLSVDRASDILNLLMLQEGVLMNDKNLKVIFADNGAEAPLRFYTKFANPKSDFYFWDNNREFSLDDFAAGRVGMMFGYHYHANLLRQAAPGLRFAVAPMIQSASGAVNYPFYYGLAVSGQTQNYEPAWKFILWLTTDPGNSLEYLTRVNQTPALRSLIAEAGVDPELGIFANQALTARSWPQRNNLLVEQIFSQMIESVLAGADPKKAAREAQNILNQ